MIGHKNLTDRNILLPRLSRVNNAVFKIMIEKSKRIQQKLRLHFALVLTEFACSGASMLFLCVGMCAILHLHHPRWLESEKTSFIFQVSPIIRNGTGPSLNCDYFTV